MDDIGDSLRDQILNENVEMLLANNIEPGALPDGIEPVDIDVTLMVNSSFLPIWRLKPSGQISVKVTMKSLNSITDKVSVSSITAR